MKWLRTGTSDRKVLSSISPSLHLAMGTMLVILLAIKSLAYAIML